MTISGTASLTEVSIKVVKPDKTILFLDTVTPSGGTFSTTFTLPENLATGIYTVTAGKGSTIATTTLTVTALPPIQLATPAKPALSGGIATWTAVTNENNGYSLKLYKDGSLVGSSVKVAHGAALSYDFSAAMASGGSYTVTVTALGSGRYVDSEPSSESDPQVGLRFLFVRCPWRRTTSRFVPMVEGAYFPSVWMHHDDGGWIAAAREEIRRDKGVCAERIGQLKWYRALSGKADGRGKPEQTSGCPQVL